MDKKIELKKKDKLISLDIIIPVFNEEEVLPLLFETLETDFSPENLELNNVKSVHYIMIDDGCDDKSTEIICGYIKNGLPASLYRFTRNFGHQNAVAAGLKYSTADVVAVIDADLQDPPEVILQMISKWREGYYVVYGERKKRKENFLKRSAYWIFYRILSYLAEIDIPHDSGDFSLMDRKVVQEMCNLPEKLRYPRVLRAWVGFRQTSVPYERFARKAGKPKYSFFKYFKLATDGITSASVRPLRISQIFSIFYLLVLIFFAAAISIKYTYYIKIIPEMRTISEQMALWFLFCFGLIALGSFIQSLLLYILSAYIGRGYLELKGRPPYIIMEVIKKDSLVNGNNSG